jgi:hypothetical protein
LADPARNREERLVFQHELQCRPNERAACDADVGVAVLDEAVTVRAGVYLALALDETVARKSGGAVNACHTASIPFIPIIATTAGPDCHGLYQNRA